MPLGACRAAAGVAAGLPPTRRMTSPMRTFPNNIFAGAAARRLPRAARKPRIIDLDYLSGGQTDHFSSMKPLPEILRWGSLPVGILNRCSRSRRGTSRRMAPVAANFCQTADLESRRQDRLHRAAGSISVGWLWVRSPPGSSSPHPPSWSASY